MTKEELQAVLKSVSAHIERARSEGNVVLGTSSKLSDPATRDFLVAHVTAAGTSLKSAADEIKAALEAQ